MQVVRSITPCYESCRIAIGETAFCRHRDGVSLRLIRRFAKMPSPIEVLRLNFRTTDMIAKRGKCSKKWLFACFLRLFRADFDVFCPIFEAQHRGNERL